MILAMFPGFEPQLLAKDVRSSQPKGSSGRFSGRGDLTMTMWISATRHAHKSSR